MEGQQEGSWILMDYDVLLVHVFHPESRAYYDLDELLQSFPNQRFSENDDASTAIGPAPSTPPPPEGNPSVA